MKRGIYIVVMVCCVLLCRAQEAHIDGRFGGHAGQSMTLTGFAGLEPLVLDSTRVAPNGYFKLSYPNAFTGMGILTAGADQSHVVVMEPGGIQLQGTYLMQKDSLKILKGVENRWFDTYAAEHPRRERVLTGWSQMHEMYTLDPLFNTHRKPIQTMETEIYRIRAEDSLYLAKLPEESYVKWYLPYRGLVSSVQTLAQYRTAEVPEAVARFRAIDYTDTRWLVSGIMKDAIEAHVWLIENSAGPMDSIYAQLNMSTDMLLAKLKGNALILNNVTDHLFDFLEMRSLFKASEYLVLKMLGDDNCELSDDVKAKMETYRKMKVGNIAPDIYFGPTNPAAKRPMPERLSGLKSDYTLVIFAASWCPHCHNIMPSIVGKYPQWKAKGVEVVLVSLDEDPVQFAQFAGSYPFISICDFKKWEGQVTKDYSVTGTPTMFMLDKNRKILWKPRSAEEVNEWITGTIKSMQ